MMDLYYGTSCGTVEVKRIRVSKRILIALAIFVIVSLICVPVRANDVIYTPSVNEVKGVWNTAYDRAVEVYYTDTYRCQIEFIYNDVDTSADDYWINFAYYGLNPGLPWNRESLKVEYRWAGTSSWTFIRYLDYPPCAGQWDITTATSTTLFLRITDCAQSGDQLGHTWYFGYEPTLTAHGT